MAKADRALTQPFVSRTSCDLPLLFLGIIVICAHRDARGHPAVAAGRQFDLRMGLLLLLLLLLLFVCCYCCVICAHRVTRTHPAVATGAQLEPHMAAMLAGKGLPPAMKAVDGRRKVLFTKYNELGTGLQTGDTNVADYFVGLVVARKQLVVRTSPPFDCIS